MPVSIYPPILKSSQIPFLAQQAITNGYPIYFTLQELTSKKDIKHIQVRIVKQYNNASIVDTDQFPDGIIYKNIDLETASQDNGVYLISILRSYLQEAWQPGFLYKVQLRFGNAPIFISKEDFADWKRKQIDMQGFSEWSTVMVIKAINEPTVEIQNFGRTQLNTLRWGFEASGTPLFGGIYSSDSVNKELEDVYRFTLYEGDNVDIEKRLEQSEWLQHDGSSGPIPDYHRFKFTMLNNRVYTVTYEIRTINGYKQMAQPYTFIINKSYLSQMTGVTFEVDDQAVYCSENGCMNIYITSQQSLNGSYVITRTSEKSNYQYYEDIKFLTYRNISFPSKTLIFQDFTIESGIKYKYAIQQENKARLRTAPLYEKDQPYRMVNFEYAYLYHDDIQLRLKFNNNMSSFKHTTLTSKQDTLGDKYPHLTKNGYAYYAEFPVNGLISLEMDGDQTFFVQGPDGYYFRDELVIPIDKYTDSIENEIIYNRDLTHDNIFVERIFREKAEEFLNNFDYKLFKSPTEGNIVVILQNVSLTPKQELGRMIYEFTSTAYEVLENTIENLDEYNIINVGQFESLESDIPTKTFGQISGLYIGKNSTRSTPTELLDEIRKIEEVPISQGYKTVISKILSLRVEQYPKINFMAELAELEAQKALALNQGKDISKIEAKIQEYEELRDYLDKTPTTKIVILEINGKEIVMGVGKIYQLDDIDEDITSIQLKYTGPIILNYTCNLVQREDKEVGYISSIDSSRIWGQIAGIFTQTDKILKNYNFRYKQSQTERIYNLYSDRTVIYGPYGDIIKDNTSINLYKSMNIVDIIKQEVKRQIEIINEIPDGFTNYDESMDQWDNGTVYYKFDNIYMLDIEADPGTILYLGKNADGSDRTEIVIGPTGRYILNPAEDLINYIMFKFPQFAIVNYKCITSQMTMTKG